MSNPDTKTHPQQPPQWSLKSVFRVFVSIVLISTITVLSLSHKDLWIECEIVVSIVGLLLFFFYFWVLYRGVRFNDDGQLEFKMFKFDECWGVASLVDGLGLMEGAHCPASFLGLLLFQFILLPIFAVVFSFLVGLGLNGVVFSITLLAMPLFYIFRSSVNFVLRNSPKCRGDALKSCCVAAGFALFKSCWFFGVVAGTHFLAPYFKAG